MTPENPDDEQRTAADGSRHDTDEAARRFVESHEAVSAAAGTPQPPVPARPSRKAAWLAMGAVALALGLIWLAPGVKDSTTSSSTAASGPDYAAAAAGNPGEPDDAAVEGKPAPLQFTLKDMNGVNVKLASFKGKIILLNFWATWCGPCRSEIPSLVDLQKQYSKDLVVLGVSVDDPVEKLKPYATEMKMNYPVLVGNGREDVQDAYGPLWGIPVSVFIDRDGKIAKKHSGIASHEQFEQEIKALL
ncbi:MAG TPA: TlpA disulfide reductase family protein [Vicinamibacterales bacterium]|nr:TlpA disulfide reductase family protein [Vicinamibacterales bacterium]